MVESLLSKPVSTYLPQLQAFTAMGGNLAIAVALGGVSATVLQAESTVSWDIWQILLVCGALVLGMLWAYVSLILAFSHLKEAGFLSGKPKRRFAFEVLFYFLAVPVVMTPFFLVSNERMVTKCDQWWDGRRASNPNPTRCATLAEHRGITPSNSIPHD